MGKDDSPVKIDKRDIQILELLNQNYDNRQISLDIGIPLSTVQRRVRNLVDNRFITNNYSINYERFGLTSGLMHIYLNDGNLDDILEKLSKVKGVVSLEVHIGNSDILAGIVYKHSIYLLKFISNIKKMRGVERIVWSERILKYPIKNNLSLTELLLENEEVLT